MSLATLGYFVFNLKSAPYQTMQEEMSWRHPTNSVIGSRPVAQFTGKDNETLNLSGVLYPEITGGKATLKYLVKMADEGDAYPFILGNGTFKGVYVIEKIGTTDSYFFENGVARKIDFSIGLKQVGDKPKNPIGDLLEATIEWVLR